MSAPQFYMVNDSIWAYQIDDDPFPREMLNRRDVAWTEADTAGMELWRKIAPLFPVRHDPPDDVSSAAP